MGTPISPREPRLGEFAIEQRAAVEGSLAFGYATVKRLIAFGE
jgi:hypothetical protein